MGKKTKKEKILAEYHRKLQTLQGTENRGQGTEYHLPETSERASPKVVNYSFSTMNSIHREPVTDYSYVLSDLKRIAILTALAICAQLVLWYRLGR